MRAYSIDAQDAVSDPADTALSLISAATIRPGIFFLSLGASGTPADNALLWLVQRFTADGTGTSVTPLALDPAHSASAATSKEIYTAEPTYTAGAILLRLALHQRATFSWHAREGAELACPDTASNGLGIYADDEQSVYEGNVDITAHFVEDV